MSENSFLNLEQLRANKNIKVRNYWRKRLHGLEWNTYFDFTRRQKPTEAAAIVPYVLKAPEHLEIALNTRAGSDKAKHIVLLATLGVLVQKYTSSTDLALFTPLYSTVENNSGPPIPVLPIRFNEFTELNFQQLLGRLKEELLQDFKHAQYPLAQLVDQPEGQLKMLPTVGMLVEGIQQIATFELLSPELLFQWKVNGELELTILYDRHQYEESYIAQIAIKYFYLLEQLFENHQEKVGAVNFLTKEEKEQLLHQFNATEAEYPRTATIVSLFEKQVRQTPDQVAVIFDDKQLSYRELDEMSNRIARYLSEKKGLKRGDLVGVMLERETYMIPVIYGILKAGGAYVPVDPHFPEERIRTIVEDSGMKLLVTRQDFISGLTVSGLTIIDLDETLNEILTYNTHSLEVSPNSSDLAYVIYTSGTTGTPKGAMIEHHSVVNRILWMQKKYPLTTADVILQKTPIVFDVSVWELFWWSFFGASLVLLKPNGEKDPRELIHAIDHYGVSTLHFVPSMLGIFLSVLSKGEGSNSLGSIRQVFASGEALKVEHVHMFDKYLHQKRGTRLINLYGPTEATVDVSYYECDFENIGQSIPIGKPIDNIRLHILDEAGKLLPVGVKGELHIAGVGLARGYLHRETLTKEKFISNVLEKESRLYKTGDLARWLPDGNIEFLGRLDHQVKISGLRIELGDIENQLLKHPAIEETIVLVKEKEEEAFLVSYYVAREAIELSQLRTFLAALLPEYMLPTYYVHLTEIPLNANGKTDRKALPEPQIKAGEDYVAPTSELEKKLVEIWAKVLKIDPTAIGIHNHFFELGGSSLKIIELNAIVNETLNLELSVAELFRYKSISTLVAFIKNGDEKATAYDTQAKAEVSGMHQGLSILSKINGK